VNRLTSAGESGTWSEGFGYDTYGNRWVTNPVGLPGLTNETPQGPGWYLAKNQISGWGYDGAGNITSISQMPRSYGYDAENRLVTAVISGATSTYSYDGDGRRVQKTTPSGTTTFVYDATGQLAAEYSTVPNTVSGPEYLTADHLGSTRLVTDASGNPKKCYDYLPFGEEIPTGYGGRTASCFGAASYPSAPDVVSEKFTGKERDAETGLDYFLTRYMSSAEGRFTSADRLPWLHWQQAGDEDAGHFQDFISDPQNFNLYTYARNNPLRFSDRTGMYYCKGSETECERLKKAYYEALAAAQNSDLGANKRAAIQRVLKFLGKPGEVNGVVATFGGTDATTFADTRIQMVSGKLVTTITFDPSKFAALAMEPRAEALVHEGVHGIDAAAMGRAPQSRAENLQTERHAYRIQSYVSEGSNVPSRWGLWDPKWPSPQAEINRQKAIEQNAQLSTNGDCKGGKCK
jgi:RHS repeat-associated protein